MNCTALAEYPAASFVANGANEPGPGRSPLAQRSEATRFSVAQRSYTL
jgi:hypothetical protein